MVKRRDRSRWPEALLEGLSAMAALVVLRNRVIKTFAGRRQLQATAGDVDLSSVHQLIFTTKHCNTAWVTS